MRTAFIAVLIGLSGAILVSTAMADPGADAARIAQGRAAFQRRCAPCHGQGPGDDGPKYLPGTSALQAKYKGALPPELELRGDLNADLIRTFVRHGSGAMPMFRKTELSDADIDAIAAYIADNAAKAKPGG
jgi:mono/diheme cytochrome c family protein